MKNIFLLIFLLIFLYIICNRCIEKFSVGGQNSDQINEKAPINISGSLTLSYIDKCECMKIWNNFIEKCEGPAFDPTNKECCEQLDIFYPMYDTCENIYKDEDIHVV